MALCSLWQPAAVGDRSGGVSWTRDQIFATVAAPLWADGRYRDRVRFGPSSMCVKVDLGIKLEILPVVFRAGNLDTNNEPFRLWRPQRGAWEDGYARFHQDWLTYKNRDEATAANFIPAIKVFKHLRSLIGLEAVSFHLECLLFNVLDPVFRGSPADHIAQLLRHIANISAEVWYLGGLRTPCGERNVFVAEEWSWPSWKAFHDRLQIWANIADVARYTADRQQAIQAWQLLLGQAYFPAGVAD